MGLPSRRGERAGTHPRGVPIVPATAVDPNLAAALDDGVVRQLREMLDDLTPPPVDVNQIPREPSAAEAWDHASNVNRRSVNLLAQIAESSGAGMRVGDAIEELARKLRFWKWVLMGVVVPIGAALVAVAIKIYSKGFDEGLAAGWRQSIEQRIELMERDRAHRFDMAPPAPRGFP